MTDKSPKARRPPRATMFSLVVECHLVTAWASKQDVWSGRKMVVCRLTCGHEVRRFSRRRFLTGERMRCKACEVKYLSSIQMLPLIGEANT